jgi:hypothetical protein
MILTVEFVTSIDVSSEKDVVGALDIEADDLHDAVERARIILSSKDFNPAVEGFRVIASGHQPVYSERREERDVLAPIDRSCFSAGYAPTDQSNQSQSETTVQASVAGVCP